MKIPKMRPHLIILDIMMPEIDGAELCRLVKTSEDYFETKVLLVTGYPDDSRVTRALAAGADDILTKPVTTSTLLARVRKLLDADATPGGVEKVAAAPAISG